MESQQPIDVPGQFETTGWFTLALRDGVTKPIPASGDLFEWAENPDEHFQSTEIFLRSPYTRDILDGAIAAAMVQPNDGEELIPLFKEIIDECHSPERWMIIEEGSSAGLADTLFMIEIDLLLALIEIRSPMGLPLALRALSDSDDGFHGVALDVIKAIGPAADAVPDLVRYIESDEPPGLSKDHFDYRRRLRCEACETLGTIGSADSMSSLLRVAEGPSAFEVRDAARALVPSKFGAE